jgi:pilus assembly protein Flp/PilA
MLSLIRSLHALRRQHGLTTVEYAVAGGLITLAIAAAFVLLGENAGSIITGIAECLSSAGCPD